MEIHGTVRKNVLLSIFAIFFLVIIIKLFLIQVVDTKYERIAAQQAIKKEAIYPARGQMLDRNKKVVVNNRAMYDLMVTPGKVKDIDTAAFCRIMDIDTAYFVARMHRAAVRNGRLRPSIFMPMLSNEAYGRILENIYQFRGFELVQRPARFYPYNVGANIFGYIHEVDSNRIKQSNNFYHPGDLAGVSGLERSYEEVLRGKRGVRYVVRDVLNQEVGPYSNGSFDSAAIAGKDLYLSLDIELQALGRDLLEDKIGSIVALDPETGGVLALVSSPDYEPDLLSGANQGNNYMKLLRNPEKPLFNRAIQAAYPPGSTFKPIDALVALDEGVITPSYGIPCVGAYYGCSRVLRCTEHWSGHSSNLKDAITWSCNSYFFDIFRKMINKEKDPVKGLSTWVDYMHSFGLGHKLGIDLPGESGGNIPEVPHYNKIFGEGHWGSCTIVSLGIGQGEVLETPLQMANAVCIIANKGFYYTPHLVDSIEENADPSLTAHEKHEVTQMPESYYNTVIEGMRGVVEKGTGRFSQVPGVEMAGKTGTAENPHGKDHSLFTAFAPVDDPKIVVAVIVENAGYGATYAAPIASLMVEKYLNDTIAVGRRTEIMDRMKSTKILPKSILEYRKEQEELERKSEAADEKKLVQKQYSHTDKIAVN